MTTTVEIPNPADIDALSMKDFLADTGLDKRWVNAAIKAGLTAPIRSGGGYRISRSAAVIIRTYQRDLLNKAGSGWFRWATLGPMFTDDDGNVYHIVQWEPHKEAWSDSYSVYGESEDSHLIPSLCGLLPAPKTKKDGTHAYKSWHIRDIGKAIERKLLKEHGYAIGREDRWGFCPECVMAATDRSIIAGW